MGIKERLAAIEEKLGIESSEDSPVIYWDDDRLDGGISPSRFRGVDGEEDVADIWEHFAMLTPEIIAAIKSLPAVK